MNKKKLKLKIEIIGTKVTMFLIEKQGEKRGRSEKYENKEKIIAKLSWNDKRNLSEKLLEKIEILLKKNNFNIEDVSSFEFNCDSPYFIFKKYKKYSLFNAEIKLESRNSKNKCGFTSWQIGEATAQTLNFCSELRKRNLRKYKTSKII